MRACYLSMLPRSFGTSATAFEAAPATQSVRRRAADLPGGTPMKLRHGTPLALALVAAMFAAGCGGSGKDELVIGEYGSLTGGDATFGGSTKTGVEAAMADLTTSAQGKIGGLPVRVVV